MDPVYDDIADLPEALYDKAEPHTGPVMYDNVEPPSNLVCEAYNTVDVPYPTPIYDTADSVVIATEDGYCVPTTSNATATVMTEC